MWSEEENEMQEYNALLSRPNADPANRAPDVANLHVNKFSRVHIGDKYVTQNVYNTKFVRGSHLVLKPESPTLKARSIRCSVTILVNAAFFVTSSLAIYLFFLTFAKEPVRLDIDFNETWYLSRADWQAIPYDTFELLKLPVKYVILEYSKETKCTDKSSCRNVLLDKQIDAIVKESEDIGPNYLISFNGLVFEGRGANVKGSMVKSYDHKSISVMFFGVYEDNIKNFEAFYHLDMFLKHLESLNVLDRYYTILGKCQIDFTTNNPGWSIITSSQLFHLNKFDVILHRNEVNKVWCLRTDYDIKSTELSQLLSKINRNKK